MHLYFNNTEEIRHRDGSFIVNFLSNRTVDRDYFTKLSVAVSVHTQEEYLFFNYMDQNSSAFTPRQKVLFLRKRIYISIFFLN